MTYRDERLERHHFFMVRQSLRLLIFAMVCRCKTIFGPKDETLSPYKGSFVRSYKIRRTSRDDVHEKPLRREAPRANRRFMDAQDEDIVAAQTPSQLKIAGGIGVLAGAVVLLTGVQTLSGFQLTGLYFLGPIALVLGGSALAVSGIMLARARTMGAILQLTFGILGLVLSGAWLLMSLVGGVVSLFALASPWLAGAALGMAVASIKMCDEVNGARRRLADKGLDLGV